MGPEGWLVAVDLQQVFRDPDSPWTAPGCAAPPVQVATTASALGGLG